MKPPSTGSATRVLLLCALGLAAAALPPAVMKYALPALSPFVAIITIVATRAIGASILLAIPVLLLVLWRRRGFCRFCCPAGWIVDLCGKLRPSKDCSYSRVPPFGQWIALLTLGGALVSAPLFLFLDPVATFASAAGLARPPLSLSHSAYASLLAILVATSLAFPLLWCRRVCPLGATQELLASAKDALLRRTSPEHDPPVAPADAGLARRTFLGVGAGMAASLLAARATTSEGLPLRPPGTVNEDVLRTLCLRCGNCVRSCPTGVIRPDLRPAGVTGFLLPAIRFDENRCLDTCNGCGQACPSGAIESLALGEKNERKIGFAHIEWDACLLRVEKECSVCVVVCPRGALVEEFSRQTYSAAIKVDADACNGCGACVAVCPPRAIAVRSKRA